MKKLLSILSIMTLSVMLFAQAPQSFSYQTVIRDASWIVLDNQSVGLKISILEDVSNGTVVYEESHSATTSQIGLVSVSVGDGAVMSGLFNTIDWGNHSYFIEVAVDVTGGTNYTVMGTTQLRSVPYALYAETSGSSTPGPQGIAGADGNDGAQGIQGTTGLAGADGNDGAQGIQGIQGTTGLAGADGNDGAQGIQGTTGLVGATGTNGLPGADGTNGVDGTNGTNGADGMNVLGTAHQTLYHNGTDWVATSNLSNDGFAVTTDADMNINGITVGRGAGNKLTNKASGYQALSSNTTGFKNTASGNNALKSNTTGGSNTASGYLALNSNTTGWYNTASGNEALRYNTTGSSNTASGYLALNSNTTGWYNTASGYYALFSNTTGNYNTASGNEALRYNTTGSSNTASGTNALSQNTTGSNNTAIGFQAQTSLATGSNQVRIGNSYVTNASIQVAWSTTSDKRWKSDIQNSNLGLNFISKLRPVSYYRNNDESKKTEYGFIAQELEEALNNVGASNNGIISKDDEGMYGVRYNDLISPMVKAIQEQQEMINILQQENKEFKERIVQLENK